MAMRHIIIISIISLLLSGFSQNIAAQQRFQTADRIFSGKISGVKNNFETMVEGKQLEKYHLFLFHSIQCTTSSKGLNQIYELIDKDLKTELSEKDVRKDQNGYKFVMIKADNEKVKGQYLIFKRNSLKEFVIVYLEGEATPDQLKDMFNK